MSYKNQNLDLFRIFLLVKILPIKNKYTLLNYYIINLTN